jgi:hypothetical protein
MAVIRALENTFRKFRKSSLQEIYVCVVDKDELDNVVELFTSHFAKSYQEWIMETQATLVQNPKINKTSEC